MKLYTFEKSYRMFEEARAIVPNGIYGPRTPHFLTYGSYPCFFTHGRGSHVWDVDGNEYIDYMCSFGTNVLGMCNPEVDAAAADQMARGNSFTLPTDRWNELASLMVRQVDGMDWTAFGKNGSDVTTYATTIARKHTGRRIIINLKGAYNGAHFWCSHSTVGVPDEYRAHVLSFAFNDLDDLAALLEKHRGDVAGIMLTPHHHPAMADQALPADGFYAGLQELCKKEGAVFIMDDIRCGFRLHERGSHRYYGCEPDLACFGKAMANGYPISAITGKASLKPAAEACYFTGTHFFAAVPMAAAIATIGIINRDGIIPRLHKLGTQLRDGITAQAAEAGLLVRYTGHPVMPFLRFEGDTNFSLNRFFCGEAARRGIFLHPHHNWFVCAEHTGDDIARTLEVTRECFGLVREKTGA
ncbi:MAG TPA: aminotransferase class III-fold pyridoxal phosphate-dependent enzyme [Spirochaetota bacterium]|nr:aminotransferase class III-fold pyridoxal phosphate-dependent enzyme [Spirochaetota bacterium]HPG51467.1 aminotransferase class III-fold pyridoxal phosphate-dependent enzyme [Spirochaetota bacterium]HPN10422.1 aminotransferase class III-fold pyridoxal phosphate-dependent enzyme [Spirochaetota bacterium]HQL82046.1 aminotransferase class III-fold pyridoxal phosphate-dependent enzyme [Spirochaetota bacterium]